MSSTALAEQAALILAAAASGVAPDRTGNDPPDRVYVSHGEPAVDVCLDCTGQLSVHVDRVESRPLNTSPGAPAKVQTCALMPVAVYVVQLWRCVPIPDDRGAPPRPDELTASARALARDGWALLTHLIDERAAGALGDACDSISFDDLVALGPDGGAAGWALPISAAVSEGGPPDLSS